MLASLIPVSNETPCVDLQSYYLRTTEFISEAFHLDIAQKVRRNLSSEIANDLDRKDVGSGNCEQTAWRLYNATL